MWSWLAWTAPWRTHSGVPRRDSSRRLAFWAGPRSESTSGASVGLRADAARRSACATILFLLCSAANAVIIDRMAVVVGTRVIKDSDIERDIRLTDFLNGDKLDLSSAARRKAAQRLIDQALIRQEVDTGRYTAPSADEIQSFLKQVRSHRDSLQSYGITQQELDSQVRWQITVLHFIEQRFRPAVLVSDQEIQDHYRAHTAEFRDAKTGKIPPVDDVRDQIQDILAGPKVTKEFEDWLDRTRKRTTIEYREASLE
jgi:uncharacterized protein YqeY